MIKPIFLYLRGTPGVGKITVARILQKQMDWRLFWLHDLDGICKIVGDHRIPRLMDEITQPILRHLMETGQNIIYVRPSRDRKTVEIVRETVLRQDYDFLVVSLTANYLTLLERVRSRPSIGNEHRITTKEGLDEYLNARPMLEIPNNYIVNTDNRSPTEVADKIKDIITNRGHAETH